MPTPSLPTPRFKIGDLVAATAQGEVTGVALRRGAESRYIVAIETTAGQTSEQVFAEHQLALLSAGGAP